MVRRFGSSGKWPYFVVYRSVLKPVLATQKGGEVELPAVVTVDGPSGAGKGTLCRLLADRLGWNLLDSGSIYRLLALVVERRQVEVSSSDQQLEDQLARLAADLRVRFILEPSGTKVLLDGIEVQEEIGSERIGGLASKIAVLPRIRNLLLQCQRDFRHPPGLVADGRDMGTVVFPDAAVKFFLYATPKERARRRLLQLQQKGINVTFDAILQEMELRDRRDMERRESALVVAEGALLLDSTGIPIELVTKQALHYVRQVLGPHIVA